MTLRGRLVLYMALASLASCTLTVAVAVVLVRHRVVVQRVSALDNLATAAAVSDSLPGARVYGVASGHARRLGPRRSRLILAAVPTGTYADGTTTAAGRSLLYAIRPALSGRVVVVRPAAIAFSEWRPFLISLVLAGAGGALLAALLAFAVARRLTRPVAELVSATHRLAAGAEGVTVPARGDGELAELGEAFNRMSTELARARAGQRTFLESVSHELRTPLTSIRGYAEALEEDAVGREEGARVIAAEAGRLERLVADLLELARMGREGFAVASDEVDLAAVAARAVERHQRGAAQMEVELREYAPAPAPALGDEDRLFQVTSNLIENALRLTPAGGRVEVRAAPGELAVRDTGPGLAAADLPRAFERFYLHARYRSERPVGSGLGLAIVRELAEAMGGSVQARAADGGGAEFVLRLPTPARSARPDAVRPSA